MDSSRRSILEKQGYHLVGEHSAVKLCHWLKSEITGGPGCYKESFYGVRSHRCLQMTPTVDACNLSCLFCWRAQDWGMSGLAQADDPELIVDQAIQGQRILISGFKGDPRVERERFMESYHPNQVAVSLSGEPTLYKCLGELLEVFHRKGMTTFLVTNGTTPKVLEGLDPLPTQLYVTVPAATEESYRRLVVSKGSNEWRHLNETLELLPSLDTRRVIRHTLVEGWNMGYEKEYASLDLKANPHFIECKAYMFVGQSRLRLREENMPLHSSIREFSNRLSAELEYGVAGERDDSRVALLSRDGGLHPLKTG